MDCRCRPKKLYNSSPPNNSISKAQGLTAFRMQWPSTINLKFIRHHSTELQLDMPPCPCVTIMAVLTVEVSLCLNFTGTTLPYHCGGISRINHEFIHCHGTELRLDMPPCHDHGCIDSQSKFTLELYWHHTNLPLWSHHINLKFIHHHGTELQLDMPPCPRVMIMAVLTVEVSLCLNFTGTTLTYHRGDSRT